MLLCFLRPKVFIFILFWKQMLNINYFFSLELISPLSLGLILLRVMGGGGGSNEPNLQDLEKTH